MHVVATAGHVDHGKSTLVLTLTGTDPDRWAEEKARGLTIDLGFAHTRLASGAEISFVDVPGHVRFIKNMLAGVGAVDACLFVVAATEGWKPQSEEHLRILQLLGVSHGVIALTKVGVVDDDWHELARMDVADHVAGTFLADAALVSVDSLSGLGIGDLGVALDDLLATTPTAADRGRARMWIDRVFAAKGSGTVVTGTLAGGSLAVDDTVELVTPRGRLTSRVRGLQSHGEQQREIGPGHRVAVNLSGVHHDTLARGDAVVRAGVWHTTRTVDASLAVLSALDHEVSRRGAYSAYLGSGEFPVKVRILGVTALAAGDEGFARIHLPSELPLVPGDRFVLREHGRGETVGGGEVLDVAPARPASKARPSRSVARIVAERRWVDKDFLERVTGERYTGLVTAGRWVVHADALEAERVKVRAAVEKAGALGLDLAVLDDRARAVLPDLAAEGIAVEGGRLKRADVADPLADHPFVRALEGQPFSPPDATGVDRSELRELVKRGLVVERESVWFAPSALSEAARRIAHALASTHTGGVTVADVRDMLGSSRKHVLPLLNHLDATGVTRRRGDVRIAGPRLPS